MQSVPTYSAMVFSSEISDELIKKIENWIQKGIKVYLFTFDVLEDYETRENWQAWRKKHFFYWYEIRYQPQYDGKEVYFFDGNITDPQLYEYLCQQSQNKGLYSFNQEQYEIEHAPLDKHVSVIAGAGTGKTTVMINRLMFLKHVAPDRYHFSRIAMITFTNEAAVVIRRRVYQRLRDYYELTLDQKYLQWMNEVIDLHISTIHTFAKTLFEREGKELGFPSNIQIRNFYEQRKLLIEHWIDQFAQMEPDVYKEFQQIPHYELVRAIGSVIEKIDNQSIHINQLEKLDYGTDEKGFYRLLSFVIKNSMEELHKIKQENSEWEVTDLIRRLIEFRELENFQPRIRLQAIMVDEFQDTDAVQVRFLLWLQRTFECTLFVVGDVKQSIYRFRGADYTAFEQLHEGLPPNSYRKITLKKNYRTGEKLLEEFDQYFSLWGEKIKGFPYSQEDRLQAMRQDIEGELIIKRFKFDTVFKEILAQLEGTETAILVRSNQDILEIVQRCEELGFFCEGKISGNFYRSLPVRELYLLIRFLLLPQSASTYYALHRSSFGDNTLSNQEIIDQFQPNRRYVADLLANQPDHKYWNEILRLRHTIPPIVLLEKIIREREPHKTYVKRLWQRILSEQSDRNLNYIQELCRQKMIEYQNQLQYLMFILKRHFSDSVATLYGIEHFLRIQIATNHEENGPEKDNLVHSEIKPFQCMTVHKAKGLEFDHVILPLTRSPFISEKRPHIFIRYDFDRPQVAYQLELQGRRMSNSIFSQLKDTERLELVAEEVRLLYVAMTRAKKKLFIQTPIYDRNNRRNSWAELLGWRGEVSVV